MKLELAVAAAIARRHRLPHGKQGVVAHTLIWRASIALQHGKSDPPTQTQYPPRAQDAGHPRPLATRCQPAANPLPTPSTPARVIDDLDLTTRPPQADARLAAVSRAEHFVRGPRLSPVDPSVGRLIGGRACTKSALLLATMPCASPEAAS